jgi:hypothetical protein
MSGAAAGGGGGSRRVLEMYTRLNTELVAMIDHFTNLVRATKEGGGETPGGAL